MRTKNGIMVDFVLVTVAVIIIAVIVAWSLSGASRTKTITPGPLRPGPTTDFKETKSGFMEAAPITEETSAKNDSGESMMKPAPIAPAPPTTDQPDSETPPKETAEAKPRDSRVIPAASLINRQINIESVVLIRCRFESQYFKTSYQPWNEERYSLGSGVIISTTGHVLSAKHIFEPDDEMKSDLAGREWTRTDCAAAQTDANQTPIHPTDPDYSQSDPEFKTLTILFEPSEKEYNNANDLDFIITKADGFRPNYHQPETHLVEFEKDEKIIAVGYPGKVVSVPQALGRWDGKFQTLASLEGSTCSGEIEPCGLRYLVSRLLKEYQDLFYKESSLGIYSPFFRGGFSGAPAFYNGNLIGIVTHGESGDKNAEETDKVLVLTSFDILETLKQYDISF